MESDARYTWVGAGVLLLVAALVGAIVWLNHIGGRGDFAFYTIHFEEQALDGLDVGADVSLRGIKVGRVEDYALSPELLNRVTVEIRVDRRTPIRQNTVAVVTRNFVTGIAAITLVNPEPAGPPLVEVPEHERHPVIGEGRSDLQQIAGRVNQVGEMAAAAQKNINQVLSPENRAAFAETLTHLRDASAALDARLQALDATLHTVGRAADRVGATALRLGDAGNRLATVGERSGAELDKTLAEARTAMQQAVAIGQSLEQHAGRSADRVGEAADRLDDRLGAALIEMRLSLEAINRVIDGLREPRSALLGPGDGELGPGEKAP